MPVIPHFASECLEILGSKNIKWPEYDEKILQENIVNIVIQINGKKRGLVQSETNMEEDNLIQIINRDEKIYKYLEGKNIKRKIYIKDKLLNIII